MHFRWLQHAGGGARATYGHSNFQRVDLVWKNFSHIAKTTLGRTANTGSFMDRMSSFIEDMSKLYLGLYLAMNLRRAATSAISAMPSTITASFACSVQMTQLLLLDRLRAFRDLLPVLNSRRPSCHRPQTTIVCGEPSGLTVVIQ